MQHRVLLVDDHAVVRDGLAQVLNQEPDFRVVGEASDAHQALEQLESLRPDVAVVDLSLVGRDGLDLLKDVKRGFGSIPVLVLSMHDESVYAERALRAGARGYIMKSEKATKVVAALRKILSGEIYLSERMSNRLLNRSVSSSRSGRVGELTDRELHIFRMLGQGLAVRTIADQLHISARTVEAHREHIKQKLGLSTGSELLRIAIEHVVHEQRGTDHPDDRSSQTH